MCSRPMVRGWQAVKVDVAPIPCDDAGDGSGREAAPFERGTQAIQEFWLLHDEDGGRRINRRQGNDLGHNDLAMECGRASHMKHMYTIRNGRQERCRI
jgi:hypothetical protein